MVQVASFDGTNDYATAADSASLRSPSTAITFGGWLYRVGNGQTWGNVVSKNLASGSDPYSSYTVFTNSSSFGSFAASVNPAGTALGDNQCPPGAGATTIPTGVWKFIAVIWQASTNVTRYRIWNADGTSFYDQSKTLPSGTTIGYDAGALVFGGNALNEASAVRLARWGIHNAILSDGDLDTWRTTGTPPTTFSGGFWTFDNVWTDSAQGNTLTATNGATFATEASPPWSAGGTNATVIAVRTTGSATAPTPVVTATSSPTVAAVRATAIAAIPAPSVSAGVNGSVAAVSATASAVARPPVLSTAATVTAVRTQASAVAQPPAVEAEAAVSGGGPATATAVFLPPTATATRSATVVGVSATASAVALPPGVSAGGSVTVNAVPASASAAALSPVVAATRSATVASVPASASAVAPPPTVTTTGSATVQAVPAGGSASVLPPALSTSATVSATPATGAAVFRSPVIDTAGNATVQVAAAQAYAAALVPVLQAVRNAGVASPPAVAIAAARAPFVFGAGPVIPGVARALVGYLRDEGTYVGRLHDNSNYEARPR